MIYLLNQFLFLPKLVNNNINMSKLLSSAIVLCLGWLVLPYLSWTSLFVICWVLGLVLMLSTSYLGVQGILFILVSLISLLLIKTILLFFGSLNSSLLVILGDYAYLSDNFSINLVFLLDNYSLSYILLTTTIGLWALLFASNYMRNEPRIVTFILLLYFFLISMILLLSSGNFPTLMLGWELIGCFSFLLINFWTTRVGTAKSAFKAFFFNKLSDAALIGAFITFILFLPTSFYLNFNNLYLLQNVFNSIYLYDYNIYTFTLVLLIVCSFCKSAQFGFHVWLPDSMEAPVPASALIHSATLVSAGIFLLGRVDLFMYSTQLNSLFINWVAFTALYGGIVASYQTDLKKILAYSTISHCGFLFLLVSYNNVLGLVLYLHLHGWFKSYSFMAAGNIITKYQGYQDYRRMGGLGNFTTIEIIVLTISIACLGGLPFLLGFFNKHYLLLFSVNYFSLSVDIFLLSAAFTGLFYTLKTVYNLTQVQLKTPFFNKNLLISGLNSEKLFTSSSPLSNLLLFGLYPVFIGVFASYIILQEYFTIDLLNHSIFGIFFFICYIFLILLFLKQSRIAGIVILFFVKILYLA